MLAYMAVAASSALTRSGPRITGPVTHVVIVKTDAGYGPDPSAEGTGLVLSQLG